MKDAEDKVLARCGEPLTEEWHYVLELKTLTPNPGTDRSAFVTLEGSTVVKVDARSGEWFVLH